MKTLKTGNKREDERHIPYPANLETAHDQDGYYIFPFGRFFDMWREGVAAEKTVPYEQPFVKAWK